MSSKSDRYLTRNKFSFIVDDSKEENTTSESDSNIELSDHKPET